MRIIIAIMLVLFVLLQYDLWTGEGSIPQVWRLQQSIEQQKQKNNQLAERNSALQAEVRDLKQGMEAIEERARSELGMIKEGEAFFHVVDN